MAEHGLTATTGADAIGDCLRDLRRALRWRSDVDDLMAELEDHLRETAERLVDRGADPHAAPGLAVQRLGDRDRVARSFADNPSGRLAVPTRLTRAAGSVALLAAGLWVLAGLLSPLATDLFVPWSEDRYLLFSGAVVLAALATLIAVSGLLVRAGAGPRHAAAAVVVLATGVAAFFVATWLWQIGAALTAFGAMLALSRARAHRLRPPGLVGLVVGAPLSVVAYLLDRFDTGPADGAVASLAGFLLVALAHVLALGRLGSWLRAETAVDVDEYLTTA